MLKTNDMQKFFSRMLKENIWGIPAQYLSIYLDNNSALTWT